MGCANSDSSKGTYVSDPSRQLLLLSATRPPVLPFFPMGNRIGWLRLREARSRIGTSCSRPSDPNF